MNLVRKLALGLLLAGVLTCAAISASPQDQPSGPSSQVLRNQNYSGQVPGQAIYPPPLQSAPAQFAHQYVEAKKDEEKKEIRKKLTDALGQQFDVHIQQQQKELEDLEKQIAALKTVAATLGRLARTA